MIECLPQGHVKNNSYLSFLFSSKMKKLLFLPLCLLFGMASAQLMIEEEVTNGFEHPELLTEGYLPVGLLFYEQFPFDSLAMAFESRQAGKHERVTTVLALGQAHAERCLAPWKEHLAQWEATGLLRNRHESWLANGWFFEMKAELLPLLQQLNPPAHLMWDAPQPTIRPGEFVAPAAPESVATSEPGLRTIKANALWAMGYSGHGQMAYVYDSGTRNEHPALREQFIGNRFGLSQGWRSFHGNTLPTDRDQEHGTHVAGTIVGLEKATNDTVGVAPAAYFMSNDIIPSGGNANGLVDAYQFALNPDGNASTSFDVPDVINNSWGSQPSQSLCSFMAGTFAALEAAGIGNIYAAGNNGPNPFTVGLYGAVSTDSLRNFAVGNINASTPAWLINSTSSRGPTVCANNAPLNIKPEVSAPGTNIRSSVGESGYSQYTGTSMASPHVTGGYLLLKEAYPTASPRQILNALYQTAIDLGDPGEDNTYGRGMIDLLAAFNFLDQTLTPVAPDSRRRDLAIQGIQNRRDGNRFCESGAAITENLVVKNVGKDTVSAFTVYFGYNNYNQLVNWNGQLRPGQETTLALNLNGPLPAAITEFKARIVADGPAEKDTVNNLFAVRMRRQDGTTLFGNANGGVHQNFANASVLGSSWFIENLNHDFITWETHDVSGLPGTTQAMKVRMGNYSPAQGQRDELVSPYFTPQGNGAIDLHFRMAYRTRAGFNNDSLIVYRSTDCSNWTEIYRDGGSTMATYGTGTEPTQPAHWRTISISQALQAGTRVSLKFVTRNGFGGNLYLTNISYGGVPLGEIVTEAPAFNLYPNPTSGMVKVALDGNSLANRLLLTDITGRILLERALDAAAVSLELDLNGMAPGLYLVQLEGQGGSSIKKLVKQ